MADQDAGASMDAARRAFGGGDIASAERICTHVLARDPRDWAAWALLTETALQRGRPDAAIVCAERAVALSQHSPIPLILRAKCRFMTGKIGEARADAELAATNIGTAPEALDALGAIFGLLGLHERAKTLFQRAVATCADVPQYLFNLAATERMTGALADAEAHCDAALALDRRYGLAHYLRSDLRTQTAERNHVADMEAALADGGLPVPSEVLIRFALGKECEDLGHYQRAFAHVQAGCALQRALIGVARTHPAADIDRVIRLHTRDWLNSAPRGFAAAAPIFVMGLPRTGTTLVERIIASHPAVRSVGETSAFAAALASAAASSSAGKTGSRSNPESGDPENLGRLYMEAATAFGAPPNMPFVDKTLENYLYCGLIRAALPGAKIILVRRHPMDACWAMYKAHFQGKFTFTYDQIELADYYLAFRRLARHWMATLPPHALLEIAYEDIVHDQEAASRKLIGFVGLPWHDDVLRFHDSRAPSATASAVQVRRPIYASSIGKWRHHAQGLAPLRERLRRELAEAELA